MITDVERFVMQKSDFMRRYIDRIKTLDLTVKMELESAERAFEEWGRIDTPEDCAEHEIECWLADTY